jgi:hypothetical protein
MAQRAMTASSSSIARSQLAFFASGVVAEGDAAPVMGYRRVGEAYAVDRKCGGELLDAGGNATVRFVLPGAAEADFLQFDVPAVPGVYRIERLVVRGVVVADLARRVIAVAERLLEGAAPGLVRYAADAQRPMLEIDIRGLGASVDDHVDVMIAKEDGAVELRAALALRADDLAGQLRKQTRELGDLAFSHGQELRRQSLRMRDQDRQQSAMLEELRSLESLQNQLSGSVQAQFDAHSQALQLAHEKLDRLMACMQDARGERKQLATHLQQVQAEVGRVTWSLENVFWRRWLRRLRGVRK